MCWSGADCGARSTTATSLIGPLRALEATLFEINQVDGALSIPNTSRRLKSL